MALVALGSFYGWSDHQNLHSRSMSANDYIELVKTRNPKLFQDQNRQVNIRSDKLLDLLRNAFKRGMDAGSKKELGNKSLFKSIFGPGLR